MPRHPADVDIVAFADGDLDEVSARAVARHVDGCNRCSGLLESLLPTLDVEMSTAPAVGSVDLSPVFGNPPYADPAVGNVWRAEWDTTGLVVLVIGLAATGYTAVPLTFERPTDPVSYEIPAGASPVGVPLHAWPALSGELPLGVFLTPVGNVPGDYVDVPLTTMSFGTATAMQMAELIAAVTALATAPGIETTGDAGAAVAPLADLLRAHPTSALNTATGIPLEVITGYKRGARTPTADEAERLAGFLGVPAASLTVPVELPTALLRAVQRPIHRPRIRQLARDRSVPEVVMRRRVAEDVLPMAARTTAGDRDLAAWDELVSQYLHE